MFIELPWPEKGWRPPRDASVRRALRGEAVFTEQEQEQYDQLLKTVTSGVGLVVESPYLASSDRANSASSRTGGLCEIASSVRIRLLDVEGYVMETKRVGPLLIVVRLHEEMLVCSALGCRINVVEWQREHPDDKRLRRTHRCPYHKTSGVLIPPKEDSDEG